MKTKHFSMKSVISMLLAVILVAGTLPVSVFAAQKSDYEDPADNWLKTNNRTNELDMNATVTYETQWCPVCNKHTTVLTYRVPEYTKSGQTAMNHGVKWSDGYDLEGKKKGNTDSGTPGVDASYTGYHYTKSVCQTCGTINSVDGSGAYNFNNNVYVVVCRRRGNGRGVPANPRLSGVGRVAFRQCFPYGFRSTGGNFRTAFCAKP